MMPCQQPASITYTALVLMVVAVQVETMDGIKFDCSARKMLFNLKKNVLAYCLIFGLPDLSVLHLPLDLFGI